MSNRELNWIPVKCSGDVPMPRCSHASAVFEKSLFIYGGWRGSDQQMLSDLYELNTGLVNTCVCFFR